MVYARDQRGIGTPEGDDSDCRLRECDRPDRSITRISARTIEAEKQKAEFVRELANMPPCFEEMPQGRAQ